MPNSICPLSAPLVISTATYWERRAGTTGSLSLAVLLQIYWCWVKTEQNKQEEAKNMHSQTLLGSTSAPRRDVVSSFFIQSPLSDKPLFQSLLANLTVRHCQKNQMKHSKNHRKTPSSPEGSPRWGCLWVLPWDARWGRETAPSTLQKTNWLGSQFVGHWTDTILKHPLVRNHHF